MSTIRITIDGDRAAEAFRRVPDAVLRHVRLGTEEGAQIVARDARGRINSKHSTLANSIRVEPLPDAGGILGHEAAAGANYAAYVEHGTGPAAGRPRYYPNPDSLQDYMENTTQSRGFKRWARGAKREAQRLDIWFRSRAWAWSIYMKGTKPHPYMKPAAEASDARVRQVLRVAVERGIREAFGAAGGGNG